MNFNYLVNLLHVTKRVILQYQLTEMQLVMLFAQQLKCSQFSYNRNSVKFISHYLLKKFIISPDVELNFVVFL